LRKVLAALIIYLSLYHSNLNVARFSLRGSNFTAVLPTPQNVAEFPAKSNKTFNMICMKRVVAAKNGRRWLGVTVVLAAMWLLALAGASAQDIAAAVAFWRTAAHTSRRGDGGLRHAPRHGSCGHRRGLRLQSRCLSAVARPPVVCAAACCIQPQPARSGRRKGKVTLSLPQYHRRRTHSRGVPLRPLFRGDERRSERRINGRFRPSVAQHREVAGADILRHKVVSDWLRIVSTTSPSVYITGGKKTQAKINASPNSPIPTSLTLIFPYFSSEETWKLIEARDAANVGLPKDGEGRTFGQVGRQLRVVKNSRLRSLPMCEVFLSIGCEFPMQTMKFTMSTKYSTEVRKIK